MIYSQNICGSQNSITKELHHPIPLYCTAGQTTKILLTFIVHVHCPNSSIISKSSKSLRISKANILSDCQINQCLQSQLCISFSIILTVIIKFIQIQWQGFFLTFDKDFVKLMYGKLDDRSLLLGKRILSVFVTSFERTYQN